MPLALAELEDAEVEVAIRTLLDGRVELREVGAGEGNTNGAEGTVDHRAREQKESEPTESHLRCLTLPREPRRLLARILPQLLSDVGSRGVRRTARRRFETRTRASSRARSNAH